MSLTLLIASLVAGMFSILAPCVIGILPVLLARSVDGGKSRSMWWILGGLAGSIFVFSILLKSTTLLIDVPDAVWRSVSGVIIILFGASLLWPSLWERFAIGSGFALKSQQLLAGSSKRKGRVGDILIGASLGPIFSACSPTYLLIVAAILPANPVDGIIYLLAYIFGLLAMTGLVVAMGKRLVKRLVWGLDPDSKFRKLLGAMLVTVGVMIALGLDKMLLTWLVANGWFDWQTAIEQTLI